MMRPRSHARDARAQQQQRWGQTTALGLGTGESQGPLHINPKMRIHKKHYASQLKEQYNTREVVVVYGHRLDSS
jgi:hypothetical protein